MKKVYADPVLAEVYLRRHVLENNGIACVIRQECLQNLWGSVSPSEWWAELWVLKDEEYERATELLRHPPPGLSQPEKEE